MGNDITIGTLRAELVADSAKFESGTRKGKKSLDELIQGMSAAGKAASESGKQINDFAGKAEYSFKKLADGMSAAGTAALERQDATAKLVSGMSQAGQEAEKATQKITLMDRASAVMNSTMASLGGVAKSAFGQFTAANLAADAVKAITSKVGDFIATGQKLPAVQASFDKLASGLGQNSNEMLASMDAAAKGMVSDFDLMQSANKAMLLGLPVTSETMGELTKAAVTLGRAMGQDATKSVDDLITALGRSSPQILDNLGLTVKLGDANDAYAAKLGKTADQLTDAERKMAFYEAAMDAARKKTAELGDQTKTLGEIIDTAWTKAGNVISHTTATINVGIGNALSSGKNLAAFLTDLISYGPAIATLNASIRDEISNAKRRTEDISLPFEKATDVLDEYWKKLATVAAKSSNLTEEQKRLILWGNELHQNVSDIAKALGIEESAVEGTIDAHDKAADATKRHREELKKFNDELKKFKEDEYRDLMKVMNEGIKPDAVRSNGSNLGAIAPPPDAFDQQFLNVILPGLVRSSGEDLGAIGSAPQSVTKKFSLANFLGGNLTGALQAAFQGGGSALKSVGGVLGGGISGSLFGLGGDAGLSGLGGKVATGAANMFGSTVGTALGSLLPGIGTVLGPLIGKGLSAIGGAIKGLFTGGEGHQTNVSRDQAIKDYTGISDLSGAQNQLRELAVQAGVADSQLRQLFGTGKVKDFENTFKSVTDKIKEFTSDQEADQARLQAAIEKYGFTFEQLGPTLQKQQLGDVAKDLIEDWRVLVNAGLDVATVNEKMADSVNSFLQTALSVGAEVPAAMKPILQTMIDQGKLFDANGNKIEDLQAAGITFSETMTQGFDRVVKKLDELITRLGIAGSALSDLPQSVDVNFDAGMSPTTSDIMGPYPMPAGGSGIVSSPTLFLAGDAGPEEVAFSGAGRKLDRGGMDVETRRLLQQMHRTQREMPRLIGVQIRDALAGV